MTQVADDVRVLLFERARTAREVAQEARRRSEELRLLLEEWRQGTMTSRCAWCRRYRVGDRWLEARITPPTRANRTTHTICEECVEALRASGLSA